ncbi:glycerate kinase family protein [Cellulomonas sp. URHB0016]
MHVLICPDKFKGTASADEVARAMARAVERRGWDAVLMPMADGGDGTLTALGGPTRTSTVTGPLGSPVTAGWRLDGDLAVIEAAHCAGLVLAGGPTGNRPLEATTHGVGELLLAAVAAGARRILVTVGGVATTDGGDGVWHALGGRMPDDVDVRVACDVTTRFLDAARVFGPQKGATAADVETLSRRLVGLRDEYLRHTGCDVQDVPGGGAAGGLAGGLAALGARLVPGIDLVADVLGLDAAIAEADLVLTGEGRLDQQSFEGKVVGGVAQRCARAGVPCLAVVGVADRVAAPIRVLSLVDVCGLERALHATTESITAVTEGLLHDAVAVP